MTITLRILGPIISTVLAAGVAQAQSAEFLFQIGTGLRGSGQGEFNTAADVDIDSANRIFVSDNTNDRVQVFGPLGTFLFEFGTPGSGAGQLSQSSGIGVDAFDRAFVGDQLNGRVQVFAGNGAFDFTLGGSGTGNGQFTIPGGLGIAVDSTNRIVVSDEFAHRIQVFDDAGVFQFAFGSPGAGNGQFNRPRGVAVDSTDRIIVSDFLNRRIQVFDSGGSYQFQFGSLGSGPGEFDLPRWVAVDRADNILVADHGPTLGHDRIQVFDPAGNFLAQFGTPGSGPLQFAGAAGLIVDRLGRVLATDTGNFRVQVLALDTDGDGIQDPVDENIAAFSDDFSDFAVGGTTSGRILARNGLTVAVRDVYPEAIGSGGVELEVGGGAPGSAVVEICGFTGFAGDGVKIAFKCSSLEAQVIQGPFELQLGDALATLPTGAEVFVDEVAEGVFELQNNSPAGTPPILIEQDGEVTEVMPGESATAGALAVDVDIKPGSHRNPINPFSGGVIPVAILGSSEFDVADVDPTTLAFGPDGAPLAHSNGPHFGDVNQDGVMDLLGHYRTRETGIAMGDDEACLTGETLAGIPIEGCDAIRTVPACGIGFELALILPGVSWLYGRRRRLDRT